MSVATTRPLTVEVAWAEDAGAIQWVGARPLHQYWPLLAPFFRDLLLPPHRRSDEDKVSWTWEAAGGAKPFSAGDLAAIRKRLAHDQQLFAEHVESAHAAETHRQAGIDRLAEAMAENVGRLVAMADVELATFVCRTVTGVRVHSWSATVAGVPFSPERKAVAEVGSGGGESPGSSRKNKRRTAWLVLAGLALVAVFVVFAARRPKPRQEPAKTDRESGGNSASSGAKLSPHREAKAAPARERSDARAGAPSAERKISAGDSKSMSMPAARVERTAAASSPAAATRTTVETPLVVAAPDNGRGTLTGTPAPEGARPARPPGGDALPAGVAAIPGKDGASVSPADDKNNADPHRGSTTVETADTVEKVHVVMVSAGASPAPPSEPEHEIDHAPAPMPILPDGNEPRAFVTAPASTASGAAADAQRSGDFTRELRWRGARWALRLVEDRTVPTLPRRVGSSRPVEELRAAALAEMRAAQPAAFQRPAFRYGVVVEMPGAKRAEFKWSDGGGDLPDGSELMAEDGTPLASIRRSQEEGVVLQCARDARVLCWIELVEAGGEATRFEWRVGSIARTSARGARIEINPATEGALDTRGLMLVDRATGWALVNEAR